MGYLDNRELTVSIYIYIYIYIYLPPRLFNKEKECMSYSPMLPTTSVVVVVYTSLARSVTFKKYNSQFTLWAHTAGTNLHGLQCQQRSLTA